MTGWLQCWLFLQINYFQFRLIYREANDAANRLAHLASREVIDEVWLAETPEIIRDVLLAEMCVDNRGSGSLSFPMYDLSNNNMNGIHLEDPG